MRLRFAVAIDFLCKNNWYAWRNNNTGVYDTKKQCYRKLKGAKLGVSDVLGFHLNTGVMIAVEVKTENDTLSKEQIAFLDTLKKANGYAFVCHNFNQFIKAFNRKFQ